ncbi:MAG TPA: NAD(P)-dependent oxidoreductase [Candidatus Cloacimonadota bacterium]|nr:NAD(P)-dependent oxidoreductase [Candidatus Cloacimonadota bacterium]
MAGIIFFKTTHLKLISDFYQQYLGMGLWLDQGQCKIFESGNLRLGFCAAEQAETSGTITFYYSSIAEVDKAYTRFTRIATSQPKQNPDFNIYHFWARDPEGRILEFQHFLPRYQDDQALKILNPDEHKPRLLLTMLLPEPVMQVLKKDFCVKANILDRLLSKAELMQGISDAEALICLLGDTISTDVLEAAPNLKVISNYAVGYNNIDLEAAKSRNIAVCNTPGVLTESTADLTWALIMATTRRIVASDIFTREGHFTGWKPLLFLGKDVHERKLGIIGMGRIGQAVARRATGFDMKVLYTSPQPKELPFAAEHLPLDDLLREADIISLHLPLTNDTWHLLGARELDLLKPGAILINTARGAIVDEAELITRLRDQRIFAAGFDVYEHEPDIPQELRELDNVVLLPHIGSASIETRTKMGYLAAANAIAIIRNEAAPARIV